jgi:flagellar biosynthesis GTPase FlhF
MGAGASVELTKPLDASDLSTKVEAINEVARIRQMLSSSNIQLDDPWQRVYDSDTGTIYFWNTETGTVSWNPPLPAAAEVANLTATTTTTHSSPPPTPTAANITSSFIESHKTYTSRLVKATKVVMKMLNRQKVRWEHDWHQQLLDYVTELRFEIQDLRKQQASTIFAAKVQANVADKLADQHTKSIGDRATEVTAQAEENAQVHQKDMQAQKEIRHQALMVKLAARKKKHQNALKQRQEEHDAMVEKIQKSFVTARTQHGKLMCEQQERTSSWIKEGGIQNDKTGGWVMLYDAASLGVYFWHPEKQSQWERPPGFEFNLNLKQLGGGFDIVDDFEKVGDLSAGLLEKWYLDHQIEREMLEDVGLEEEITDLEDELEKRRHRENDANDLEMSKADGENVVIPAAFLLA